MTRHISGDTPMIRAAGLRKTYGKHEVLSGVDLDVARGQIFALLGPNGAGKTTTVNILTTLISPDSGSASIAGVDVLRRPHDARALIALTGQYAAVDEFQTGAENLAMMAHLAHLGRSAARRRTGELLEQFELVDAGRRRVSTYSGGMRRRLDLAISLIARPPVLFLDEPTTGLDPRSRAQLWHVVSNLADDGTTILLTTQYLEEADQLADRIAVVDGGRVVAEGTADLLKSRVGGNHVRLTFEDPISLDAATHFGIADVEVHEESLSMTIPTSNPVETIRDVLHTAATRELSVSNVTIERPSLDDVFLALTGHGTDTEPDNHENQNQEVAA
jgi:ABC-2 type transport system ATP-binding protein